jgi:hypothetical protein
MFHGASWSNKEDKPRGRVVDSPDPEFALPKISSLVIVIIVSTLLQVNITTIERKSVVTFVS